MCALAIFWTAGLIAFHVHVAGIPESKDEFNTDAIIVLTGGPDRINRGLDLLENKKAQYLFISGVNTNVSVNQLVDMWKPDTRTPCCIILGHEARNTSENAEEAKDWIDRNNIKSVRLLTTDYHMPRALLEFNALLPTLDIRTHALHPSRKNWFLIVGEYNKTIYTSIRLMAQSS